MLEKKEYNEVQIRFRSVLTSPQYVMHVVDNDKKLVGEREVN